MEEKYYRLLKILVIILVSITMILFFRTPRFGRKIQTHINSEYKYAFKETKNTDKEKLTRLVYKRGDKKLEIIYSDKYKYKYTIILNDGRKFQRSYDSGIEEVTEGKSIEINNKFNKKDRLPYFFLESIEDGNGIKGKIIVPLIIFQLIGSLLILKPRKVIEFRAIGMFNSFEPSDFYIISTIASGIILFIVNIAFLMKF